MISSRVFDWSWWSSTVSITWPESGMSSSWFRVKERVSNVPYNAPVTRPSESLANARLWLAFTTTLLISGFPNVYILFLPSLLAEFHASRAATVLPISVVWVGGARLAPIAGWLLARHNHRIVVVAVRRAGCCGLLA